MQRSEDSPCHAAAAQVEVDLPVHAADGARTLQRAGRLRQRPQVNGKGRGGGGRGAGGSAGDRRGPGGGDGIRKGPRHGWVVQSARSTQHHLLSPHGPVLPSPPTHLIGAAGRRHRGRGGAAGRWRGRGRRSDGEGHLQHGRGCKGGGGGQGLGRGGQLAPSELPGSAELQGLDPRQVALPGQRCRAAEGGAAGTPRDAAVPFAASHHHLLR
jgi:hypothetical protein